MYRRSKLNTASQSVTTGNTMSTVNFYEVLGIDADASPEDVRRAYRKKALRTHPDRLPQGATDPDRETATEQFRQVNHAYEILIDSDKRKDYDLYGVWPPPEEFPEQPKQRRGGHSGHPSHHSYPSSGARFDPFFTDPFVRHGPRPAFAFTNPFELFDSIFSDMPRDLHRTHVPMVTRHLFNPYVHRHGPLHRYHAMSPFSDFSPLIVTPHLFSASLAHDNDDLWGSGSSLPNNSSHYSYSSTTRAQYGPDGNGSQPRWVSESTVMRTVNGVTQTVHTRKDSLGNEHVTKIYPDGREKYTVNGIEQPQSSSYIQESSRSRQQHSRHHDHAPEPPIIPPDPQEGTSRKRWWGRH